LALFAALGLMHPCTIKYLFYYPFYLVDTKPSYAIPFTSDGKLGRSWGQGQVTTTMQSWNQTFKIFGRPGNEAYRLATQILAARDRNKIN